MRGKGWIGTNNYRYAKKCIVLQQTWIETLGMV